MHRLFKNLILLTFAIMVGACSENKQALDTWVHADKGSYGATISADGKYLITGEIGGFGDDDDRVAGFGQYL